MTQTTTTKPSAPRTAGRVRVLMFSTLMAVLATWAMASWAQPTMGGHGHHEMGGGMMMGGSPERTGEAVGLRTAITSLGQTVLPLAFGAFGTALGMLPLFWSVASLLGLGAGYAATRRRVN